MSLSCLLHSPAMIRGEDYARKLKLPIKSDEVKEKVLIDLQDILASAGKL